MLQDSKNAKTLLHYAIDYNALEIANYLIRNKERLINIAENETEATALHYTLMKLRNAELAKKTLDPEYKDNLISIARQLIQTSSIDLNAKNKFGDTVLHLLAKLNLVALAKDVHEKAPQLYKEKNPNGQNTLMVSCGLHDSPDFILLFQEAEDIKKTLKERSTQGFSTGEYALSQRHFSAFKALVDIDFETNMFSDITGSRLYYLALENKTDVKFLHTIFYKNPFAEYFLSFWPLDQAEDDAPKKSREEKIRELEKIGINSPKTLGVLLLLAIEMKDNDAIFILNALISILENPKLKEQNPHPNLTDWHSKELVFKEAFQPNEQELRRIYTEITSVLGNPVRVIELLKHIEIMLDTNIDEDLRTELLKLNELETPYTVQGIQYPVTSINSEHIETPRTNKFLKVQLLKYLQAHGLNQNKLQPHFVGFVDQEHGNALVMGGEIFFENPLVSFALFHGKCSHAIQMVILLLAIEAGDIHLGTFTFQEVLNSIITTGLEEYNVWLGLLDSTNPHTGYVNFSSPMDVAMLMSETEQLPIFAALLRNSFINDFNKIQIIFENKTDVCLETDVFLRACAAANGKFAFFPGCTVEDVKAYYRENEARKHYLADSPTEPDVTKERPKHGFFDQATNILRKSIEISPLDSAKLLEGKKP